MLGFLIGIPIFLLIMFMVFSPLILQIWCLVNLVANKKIDDSKRTAWLLGLILVPFSPLYFGYFHGSSRRIKIFSIISGVNIGILLAAFVLGENWLINNGIKTIDRDIAKLGNIEAYEISEVEWADYYHSLTTLKHDLRNTRLWEFNKLKYLMELTQINTEALHNNLLTKQMYTNWKIFFDLRNGDVERGSDLIKAARARNPQAVQNLPKRP